MGGPAAASRIAPQLRGRVTPRILDALEGRGWHVHRVGRAAYVHAPGDDHHLILGVWPKRAPAPGWSTRLGRPSAGYLRRLDRRARELRHLSLRRDRRGRFSHLLPWWNRPRPLAYAFEGIRPGWHDAELARAAAINRDIRIRRGLELPPDDWYGETSPTLSRAMDGDR